MASGLWQARRAVARRAQPAEVARARPPASPSTSTGPGPGADPAQAVARPPRRRSAGRRAPPRAASCPSASRAASAEECVQPEPCAAPSGWRSPAIATTSLAVEEEVGASLAVAAGDDHARGPSAWTARASSSRVGVLARRPRARAPRAGSA